MSVYLQITTRCNMKCAHCGFACTARGQDMTEATLVNALNFAAGQGESLDIGGGEPTVHPKFWPFLGVIFGFSFEYVWMATNGKRTMDALALANLANDHNFQVELSQDCYHEPIDERVVRAFQSSREGRGVGIRNTSTSPLGLINAGRAKTNRLGNRDECICPGVMVKPNGDIRPCGCVRAPVLGNVNDGGIREEFRDALQSDEFMYSECWSDYKRKVRENGK